MWTNLVHKNFLTSPLSLDISPGDVAKDKKEKAAKKAKLRRLCEDKARNGEEPRLQVPEWLHKEWKTRDHLEMALEFEACGYDKDFLGSISIYPKLNV